MREKHLVMGMVSSYPIYYLKPFFVSLKKSGYEGDTVMFVNSLDKPTKGFVKSFCSEIIEYNNSWPYLSNPALNRHIPQCKFQLSPNSLRYLLYSALLNSQKQHYTSILISDVRDVYFQKNPFDFSFKKGLSVFMEDKSQTIGTQMHNRYWIENGFGKEVVEQLFHKPISCSGVTMGDIDSMMHYLEKMTHHICTIENIPGLDQGIHNYLIQTESLPTVNKYSDDDGPVSTISIFKPKKAVKIKKGKVIGSNGRAVNVVHQYDRCDYLLLLWNPLYYFRHKLNLMKGFIYPYWTRIEKLRLVLRFRTKKNSQS
jgi:hypothetical protein